MEPNEIKEPIVTIDILTKLRYPEYDSPTEQWLSRVPDDTLFRLGKYWITNKALVPDEHLDILNKEMYEFIKTHNKECDDYIWDMHEGMMFIFHEITRRWTNNKVSCPD